MTDELEKFLAEQSLEATLAELEAVDDTAIQQALVEYTGLSSWEELLDRMIGAEEMLDRVVIAISPTRNKLVAIIRAQAEALDAIASGGCYVRSKNPKTVAREAQEKVKKILEGK